MVEGSADAMQRRRGVARPAEEEGASGRERLACLEPAYRSAAYAQGASLDEATLNPRLPRRHTFGLPCTTSHSSSSEWLS